MKTAKVFIEPLNDLIEPVASVIEPAQGRLLNQLPLELLEIMEQIGQRTSRLYR